MDVIVIPGWLINNVGGLLGFGILTLFVVKYQGVRSARRKEAKQIAERDNEARAFDRERKFDRLLPGPWRTLYKFLNGHPDVTRQAVLLAAVTFERDIDDIPKICPAGFDIILEVSYYNLGGEGNCHKEFTGILGSHVMFPKSYCGDD